MKVTGILAEKGFRAFDGEAKSDQGTKVIHTWVVVADQKQASIYRKTARGLELIAHATAKGKQIKSVDVHAFSPQSLNTQDHKHAKDNEPRHSEHAFIHRLVEWLDVAEKEKSFDHLMLVAAHQTLGDIRTSLTKNLQQRVWRELDKDLTGLPLQELQSHIGEVL